MAKTFTVGDQTLEVSDELQAYNELHYQYVLAAEESKRIFSTLYQEKGITTSDIMGKLYQQISDSLENTLFVSLRHFLEEGIYEIDKYRFEEYCKEHGYLPIYDELNALEETCQQIDSAKNMEIEQRNANDGSDTFFVVGGHNAFDLVKSSFSVDIANAAVQLGHRTINSIGNWRTERRAQKLKDSVIQDATTLQKMADSIFQSAFNTHYAYIEIMEERNSKIIPKYEQSNQRTALAMYHNIDMLLPETQLQEKITVRMLELDPYKPEFYRMLILHYGDSNREIEQIANFFHVEINPIKRTLQETYANSFKFEDVQNIKNVLIELSEKARYFGLDDEIGDEINEKIRVTYYRWVFQKYYDESTGLYLLCPENKEKILNAIATVINGEQAQIDALYEQYFANVSSKHFLQGKELPAGIYFSISNNSESGASAFCFAWDGIFYGKEKWLEYGIIHSIKVIENMVVINDTVRIPLLLEVDGSALEKFLNEAVKIICQRNCTEIYQLLGMEKVENEKSTELRVKIKKQLLTWEKEINAIRRNVTIYNPTDINHIFDMNNCKVKLNTFCENKDDIYPVYWLAAKEEYAVFTDQGIGLTETGTFIPYHSLQSECFIEGCGIYLLYENKKHLIFSDECDELAEVKQFVNYSLHVFSGKDTGISHAIYNKYETSLLIEPFACWMEKYLLKYMGNDGKNKLLKFILLNLNNQEFADFLNLARESFDIPQEEQFLLMIRPKYFEKDVILVSNKKVYTYKEGKKGSEQEILLERMLDIRVDFNSEDKELYIDYAGRGGEVQSCLLGKLSENVYVARRSMQVEHVLKRAFDYVKNYLGQPFPEDNPVSAKAYLEKVYMACTATLPKLRKRLLFIHLTEDLYKKRNWLNNSRWRFLSSTPYEKIILFYNSAKLNPGSAGIVLTDKYLYVGAKKIIKIPISDIREFRVSDESDAASICIVTNQVIYETGINGCSQLLELGDMLSALIFYIQEHRSEVVAALNNIEMVMARKAERRNVTAVFKEEQKEALHRLAEFCNENADVGLFSEKMHPQILFNDESEAFKEAFSEAVEQSEYKPDPAELPLFLLYREDSNIKKKLGKASAPIFVTNEFWYNLSENSFLSSEEKLPLLSAKAVKLKEESLTKKSKMILCFEGEVNGEYILPEVPRDAFHLYEEFYKVFLGELKQLSGLEQYSLEEARALEHEANMLVADIDGMSEEELKAIGEKLLQYDWEFAEKAEEKWEECLQKAAIQQLASYEDDKASFEELQSKREEIMKLAYPFRYKCETLEKIDCGLIALEKKSVERYQDQIRAFIEENRLNDSVFGMGGEQKREFVMQALLTIPTKQYNFWEVPLFSAVSESGETGYMLTKDKLIVFNSGQIQAYALEEIQEFVVLQGSVSVKLGIIIEEKEIAITELHRKDTERYAIVLTQIVRYLTKQEVEKAFRIRIRIITLKSKAKALKDNTLNRVNDTVDKVSDVTGNTLDKLNGATGDTFGKINSVTEGALGKLSGMKKDKTNESKKNCPKCGNAVKASGKFCGKCGYRFEN